MSRVDAFAVIADPTRRRILDTLRDGGTELFPVALRYAWPSELDLMAQLAGLDLEARHGGWHGEPFTDASSVHISVYRKR